MIFNLSLNGEKNIYILNSYIFIDLIFFKNIEN